MLSISKEKRRKARLFKLNIKEENGSVIITELEYFSVAQTFDCGQSFRFKVKEEDGAVKADGIAFGKRVSFIQPDENTLIITPCALDEYQSIWEHYLALDTDYAVIRENLKLSRPDDSTLSKAMETGKGIRILRQDPWEALCTFIISQNNNIPRITSLVASLCKRAGDDMGDGESYAFPSPEAVKALGTDGLFALKTGFRASYLYDAASKISSGKIELSKVKADCTEQAEKTLREIRGVGPKVAACALLFGFEKNDAFPIDVWVKRVMAEFYPEGVAPSEFGEYAGLAQQYLFYYKRYIGG